MYHTAIVELQATK